ARAPRTPGQRRHSQRDAALTDRVRLVTGRAGAVGVGGWLATSDGDTEAPPQDSKQSAPSEP
ncbi:serine/threonine protein kinase, partial [Streptomyces lunaelactis]|nr:serine/threonine protein kinase [Streptomyces lunaelactis]